MATIASMMICSSNLKISFRSFDVPFRSHYSFGDERNQ